MLPDERETAIEYAAYCLRFRRNYLRAFEDPAVALVLCDRNEINRDALIRQALDGSSLAHEWLAGMSRFLWEINEPRPWPESLKWLEDYGSYVLAFGRPQNTRGRPDPFPKLLGDTAIGQAVEMVTAHFDLHPTRNKLRHGKADGKPSGASLVAAALKRRGENLTEQKIERCWQDVWEGEITVYPWEQHVLAQGIRAVRQKFGKGAADRPDEVATFLAGFLEHKGMRWTRILTASDIIARRRETQKLSPPA